MAKIGDYDDGWMEGRRDTWFNMLNICLGQLGVSNAETAVAHLRLERQAAIHKLRLICEEYGDQDWEDTLALADILEYHLLIHLEARGPEE